MDLLRGDVERGVRPGQRRYASAPPGRCDRPGRSSGRARGAISSAMTARYRSNAGRISLPMTSSSWSRISGACSAGSASGHSASGRSSSSSICSMTLVQSVATPSGPRPRRVAGRRRPGRGRRAWRASERGAHRPRRRADRLVGGDVEQLDLRPVHRVDVEGGEVGVEDGAVDAQRIGQGGARGRVSVVADLGQPSWKASSCARQARSPRSSCPRVGRRSVGRRVRSRTSGGARGTPPSTRRRAGRGRSVPAAVVTPPC